VAFLDDIRNAIVVAAVVVGMKFVHSQDVIYRDLKPATVLLDSRRYPKISHLGGTRLSGIGLTLTRGLSTTLYKTPEMYNDVDYTSAIDVDAFSLMFGRITVWSLRLPDDERHSTDGEDRLRVPSAAAVRHGRDRAGNHLSGLVGRSERVGLV
jgi:serine/threonine protein kinase